MRVAGGKPEGICYNRSVMNGWHNAVLRGVRMNRILLPTILISSCIAWCARAHVEEKRSPGDSEPPTSINVRLLDEDGKPVVGAVVSTFTFRWRTRYKGFVPDESGWCYLFTRR